MARYDNGAVLRNFGCRMQGTQRWCQVEPAASPSLKGWVSGRYLKEASAEALKAAGRDRRRTEPPGAAKPAGIAGEPASLLRLCAIAYPAGKSAERQPVARSRIISSRLDDAARAGWLYYIAGKTQDEIAAEMGISRQAAQRLVSLAVSERLVRVWMEHPIAHCLELAAALSARFGLTRVEVVPTDPGAEGGTTGIGEAGAAEIVRWLRSERPVVMAIGTGRTLKAAIDHLPPVACPQHCVVSLTGNVGPDGSASYYNVIFSMAEAVSARHFPMPLPVYSASPAERELMHGQALIRSTLALAAAADVAFVGIGEMDERGAALRRPLPDRARARGGAGGGGGRRDLRLDLRPRRAGSSPPAPTSAPPARRFPTAGRCTVIALAKGRRKLPGIAAAVKGGLVNGLVTDEATAAALARRAVSARRYPAAGPSLFDSCPASRANARLPS